jgi:hypothetical protein
MFSVFQQSEGTPHPISQFRDPSWVKRNTPQLLVGLIAFAIVLIFAYYIYHAVPVPFTRTDGTWTIATNLVNGRGYTACSEDYFPFCAHTNQVTAMREPIPVLLMVAAMLVYPSQISGMIMLSLLYLGTLLVIFAIFRNVDRRPAFLAAFLWATSIPVLSEIGNDTGDLAAAFFLAVAIFFFQRARDTQKRKYWVLAGLFMGFTALSRTIFIGIGLGLAIGLFCERLISALTDKKLQILPVGLFLVSMGLVVAPWIIRNDLVFGTPVIGSTLTGYNIFRMNYIVANSPFSPHYVGPQEAYPVLMNLIHQSSLLGLENEAQMQAFYMKAGLEIIFQHPLQYIELSLYRFLPLCFNTGVGAAYGKNLRWVDYAAILQQVLLLVGLAVGAIRSRKENWPWILALILGCGAYMAVDAQLRYLVDFMPIIIILIVGAFGSPKKATVAAT